MPQPNNGNGVASFFSNLFSKIGSSLNKALGSILNKRGILRNLFGSVVQSNEASSLFRNLGGTLIGTNLTDAQVEANQFTHDERIDAQNWTAQREDTELQRRVADAKAAGINPMMVAGSGGVSSSSNGGQSVSPSASFGMGDLISLMLIPKQMKLMDAQASNLKASAEEKTAKVPFWEMSTQKALEQIEQIRAQTKTEGSKAEFYEARSYLANVTADNIKYLQEAMKNYYEASAAAQRANSVLAESAALSNYVQACYQSKLMTSGYIEQLVKRTAAETAEAYASAGEHRAGAVLKTKSGDLVDAQKDYQEITNSILDGTFIEKYGENANFMRKWNYFAGQATEPVKGLVSIPLN